MYDFTFLGLYFPPRVKTKAEAPKYDRCVRDLHDWAAQILGKTPSRSIPILCMDLNDGMGRTPDPEHREIETPVISHMGSRPEHLA
eukprot:8323444-Pyramimonas_sp.AAC.1